MATTIRSAKVNPSFVRLGIMLSKGAYKSPVADFINLTKPAFYFAANNSRSKRTAQSPKTRKKI
jgi:hypothetical protein